MRPDHIPSFETRAKSALLRMRPNVSRGLGLLHYSPAMFPCRPNQVLARFGCAERRMRRQRDVIELGQRMIRRQRLDVEDVEPGMPDMARLQRIDHGGL